VQQPPKRVETLRSEVRRHMQARSV
jgi:hypothetical protein